MLVLVGLLMTYVNHLDMVLVSDRVVREFAAAFLAGNYGCKGEVGGAVYPRPPSASADVTRTGQ